MSLHTLANHVQSAGRGDDKVLVHMTPGEVGGLQSLAMAHGGSLTINPATGLPEASFLRSLLPTLIGFGLAPFTGGLSAALITGAGYTAATGSLKKGLLAGLGAYGGAGLASGLNAMGAAAGAKAGAAGANAAQTAITGFADDAANFAGTGSNPFSVNPTFNPAASKSIMFNTPGATTPGMTSSALTQTPLYPNVNFASGLPKVAPPPSVVPPAPASVVPPTTAPAQTQIADLSRPQPALGGFTPPVAPSAPVTPPPSAYSKYMSQVGEGAKKVYAGGVDGAKALYDAMPSYSVAAGVAGPAMSYAEEKREKMEEEMRRRANQSPGLIRPYEFDYGATNVASQPYTGSAEQLHFQPIFTAQTPYEAPGPEYKKAAEGGVMGLAVGGPVEMMSAQNALADNTMYPQSQLQTSLYSNPMTQRPMPQNVISQGIDAPVDSYTGEIKFADGGTPNLRYDLNELNQYATGGGISHLGDYSDGGRLLKGPGDGVSDSIPASIGNRQPARLADGEFVIPARIVSEIGNGSTEAGARKLYAMMDRVQKARRKTVGKNQVARNTKAEKLLPA